MAGENSTFGVNCDERGTICVSSERFPGVSEAPLSIVQHVCQIARSGAAREYQPGEVISIIDEREACRGLKTQYNCMNYREGGEFLTLTV